MRKPNLSGAFGIATPIPASLLANHPDRVLGYTRLLRWVWVVRLATVAALLSLLYLTHVL